VLLPVRAGPLPPVPGGCSADDREDLPGTRQALELVAAAAFQPDRGAGDQVADGAGDQDLARAGQRGDPGPGVHRDAPDLGCGAVFHLAGVHPGPDLQAKVEKLQEQLAAAMDGARAALQAAYAMPVKDPCDGCHGIKEAAILAALQRIRLCEAAAEVLDKLAQRLPAALDRLQQVRCDLGEVYELVYQFIRKGGKLPAYARWIEGAEAGW
jgi:hypothetical protein